PSKRLSAPHPPTLHRSGHRALRGADRARPGVHRTFREPSRRGPSYGGRRHRPSGSPHPTPRRFTGRATVLFAVLIALALAYTYPVRVYLDQQTDIERIEASQAAQRRLIADRAAEAAKWQDPEYIRIQARERFYMVYPGEVPVVVLNDPDGAARDAGAGKRPVQPRTPDSWYDTLWSSVRAADAEHPGK
ncbi:septum formation initiator family protein, partial [Micromonospora sp. ATA32]|nr:septum formation initiator family protein [Micromonospora sp. ATA32]